jgi:hypothetical protein
MLLRSRSSFYRRTAQHIDATTTWPDLAKEVGYADFRAVSLHYGRLAHRVGARVLAVRSCRLSSPRTRTDERLHAVCPEVGGRRRLRIAPPS